MDQQTKHNQQIAINAAIFAANLMRERNAAVGELYDGEREMFVILGYPKSLTFENYLERYERQDIASRIIDYPPEETWSLDPVIYDGRAPANQTYLIENTEFEQAWKRIVYQHNIYTRLQRLDSNSGIGQYAVLYLGTPGDPDTKEPLTPNSLNGPDDLLYFTAYNEKGAQVIKWDNDPTTPHYGMPEIYQLQIHDANHTGKKTSIQAHWTRILHVAEKSDDEIWGKPRLKGVYNRLIDLEKIVGGSAEAAWQLMNKGYVLDVKPEYDLDSATEAAIVDQLNEFDHSQRRFLLTRGVDVSSLGSEVVDPSGIYTIILDLISSDTGIPKRVLVGSERGQLSSEQDERNWAKVIRTRRLRHAEPNILRPFIDRLIWLGALPAPRNEEYNILWRPLIEISPTEEARITSSVAASVASVAQSPNIITPQEFRFTYLNLPTEPEEGMGELKEAQSNDPDPAADVSREGIPERDDGGANEAGNFDANKEAMEQLVITSIDRILTNGSH